MHRHRRYVPGHSGTGLVFTQDQDAMIWRRRAGRDESVNCYGQKAPEAEFVGRFVLVRGWENPHS